MGTLFKAFLLPFLASFSLLYLVHGQSQPGFISIDCGSNSSYAEPITGINYVSDSSFVETGLVKSISSEYISDTLMKQLWNLRSFPEGIRNCYGIEVKHSTKYLIRSSFLYANYDGKNSTPEFDIYFGANFWTTVNLPMVQTIIDEEIIHITTSNQVQICLVNTGNGVPFISAIELRPLPNTSYVTVSGSLTTSLRLDIGAPNDTFIRFPDDIYDRVWSPPAPIVKWTPISTTLLNSINNQDALGFKAPAKVLSTASTVINASAPMEFSWSDPDMSNQYYVYMYFAELQVLEANQSRLFKIYVNDKLWINESISVVYLTEMVARSLNPFTASNTYDFKLIMSEGSTLPPILNAIEIYKVINFAQLTTEQGDVDAIESIKNNYGVTKDWQGDPCAPKMFAWQGLNCSYDASNPSRITGLDLSSSGLTGEISANISNLAKLEVLDLSNNSLSGPVPAFLAEMPLLTVLNLSGNNLSGQIPTALIDKRNKGSLSLSVEGNPDLLQETTPSEKKKTNIVVPIVAAIGGAIIIVILILAFVYFIRRRRSPNGPSLMEPHSPINSQVELHSHGPLQSPSRQFSYSDILKFTNNFGRLLGEGGFGKVYYGLIGNTEVAVKMLSPKSAQGYREFQAEVDLLLRVHHRNLTSLVGYCNEGETKMGLVYEYMGKGNLGSILLGGRSGEVLRWEDRLQIALDSAQGLEYLHNGCRPPIIHRDIKSSNILLNEYLQAKLADFGLSRAFPTEGGATHVTTKVVGTPGYLDPEYYTSYKLTEKSDVYSFGIVILELITGRPVLVKTSEKSHIIQWVDFNINKGDIYSIIDPKIKEDCNTNSVWKAADIGMSCTARNPINRPTMSRVVSELKECLSLELNQRGQQIDSATTISSTFHSEIGPMAR